ncbi:hypothetical protein [Pedobacter westerhofensis]|uniref:hypothetical protein n=1 Tax=Pedobacter westerhofensis TaxID=425512 RepID=UPI00115949E9|nr:hypothetical protein [Pedobacter westerhofensis]
MKAEFLEFIKKLRTDDYDHLDNLFKWLKEGLRMTNSLKLRKDRGGTFYYWGKFARQNSDEEAKIIAHPGIVELVKAYREGTVKIDFYLDDLISEALGTGTSLD